MLNETVVNIGSLGWVENVCLVLGLKLFEESLSNTLIDDDECDIGKWFSLEFRVIFVGEDFLELIELELYDLLAHGITDSVTIDEDLLWESTLVVILISS